MARVGSGRSEAGIPAVISDLYAAGLGDRQWTEGLASVAAFFGAAGMVLFDFDRSRGQILAIQSHGFRQNTDDDYVARMNAINPRVIYSLAQPGPHTAADYDALSEAAMRRHEFYAWLERECGVKYFIGSRMIDRGDVSTLSSVEFPAQHGHPSEREVALFELLTPHIANAWRVARLRAHADAAADFRDALQRQVPWGIVGLDRRGRVVLMNQRASAIAARADGLAVERGRLRALRAADDRTLQLMLADVLRSARGEGADPGGALAVARRDARTPYVLRIVPARHAVQVLPDGEPVVLIVVSDPGGRALPPPEELQTVLGLTRREAELALQIADGMPLSEAAARLDIAYNTARVHLTNALRKTGARSQVALAALIRSLPLGDDT